MFKSKFLQSIFFSFIQFQKLRCFYLCFVEIYYNTYNKYHSLYTGQLILPVIFLYPKDRLCMISISPRMDHHGDSTLQTPSLLCLSNPQSICPA